MIILINLIIVDDEELICRSLKSMIGRINNAMIGDISLCFNAFSASKLIIETNPHIVISDIKMPDMDGIQLIKNVRKRCPDTRFIMLSGYNEYEYVRNSFKLGAVDYLLKPISIEEISKVLDTGIKEILDEQRSKVPGSGAECIQADGDSGGVPPGNFKTVIDKVRHFVELNYHRDINLASAANHVGMNYSYFSKLFKDETGVTFSHYLTEVRMKAARKLLVDPEKKVQDVAKEVGYRAENAQNFTRAFKSYFGTPPRGFR